MSELFDSTGLEDHVEEARKIFFDEIKPAVEKQDYQTAYSSALHMHIHLTQRCRDVVLGVHSGAGYIAAAAVLYQRLETGLDNPADMDQEKLRRAMRGTEVMVRQTRLPNPTDH